MRRLAGLSAAYGALGFAALLVLFPVIWIALTSLKERVLAFQIPPVWIFRPTLDNYAALWRQHPFTLFFVNSTVVALFSTAVAIAVGATAAYALVRLSHRSTGIAALILITRTIPPVALIIPFFAVMHALNLFDTYLALVLANLSFCIPFMIWTLMGFYAGVPWEVEEAALVDGCSRLRAFVTVVAPLVAPGLAAAGVVNFLFCWNEFLYALLLTGRRTQTLPIAVANFMTSQGIQIGELSAAIVVISLPVVFITIAVRRHLVEGLSLGGFR